VALVTEKVRRVPSKEILFQKEEREDRSEIWEMHFRQASFVELKSAAGGFPGGGERDTRYSGPRSCIS
jgi:hypothetical protein